MKLKLSLILAGIVACATNAAAADIPDYPFIYVVGKADIDTPPNVATCSLTLRARDQDPGKAASTIEGRLKFVLGTLNSNHISPNDIVSFNIDKQVLTNDRDDQETASIKGYDVWRNLKFTAHQLDALPVIEGLFIGSPNIVNISCEFDRTDRTALESELLTKAVRSAKEQAEKLAEPLGRHVTAAAAVSKAPFESIASSLGLGNGLAEVAAMSRMFKKSVSADELLVPSTIRLSATVNVLFKME